MSIKDLFNNFNRAGKVDWLGHRPAKRSEVRVTESVHVNSDIGIVGDHYRGQDGKRQVTLMQSEHLDTVGKILEKKIMPELTRRNILVSAINLQALIGKEFKIGDEVVLEGMGHCRPCSRMEENLGHGGYNAMLGHGGITARVIRGGKITLGDLVEPLSSDSK